jgi:hypothetical protein
MLLLLNILFPFPRLHFSTVSFTDNFVFSCRFLLSYLSTNFIRTSYHYLFLPLTLFLPRTTYSHHSTYIYFFLLFVCLLSVSSVVVQFNNSFAFKYIEH